MNVCVHRGKLGGKRNDVNCVYFMLHSLAWRFVQWKQTCTVNSQWKWNCWSDESFWAWNSICFGILYWCSLSLCSTRENGRVKEINLYKYCSRLQFLTAMHSFLFVCINHSWSIICIRLWTILLWLQQVQ